MKKLDKIRYILKHQGDIDQDLMDDFVIWTSKELKALPANEVSIIFQELLDAEDIMDNLIFNNILCKTRRSE